MGWKGTVRSGIATIRRIERAEQRRLKQVAKQYKELEKLQAYENAVNAVAQYDDYISTISALHKNCSEYIDWSSIGNEPPPEKPQRSNQHENAAEFNLKQYTPSFLDRLLGLEKGKRQKLELNVMSGKISDDIIYEQELSKYNHADEEWKRQKEFTNGILNKDINTYHEVITWLNPFEDIAEIGSQISIEFEKNLAEVNLLINGKEVIPDFILSQTSTGKLTKKKMPISKRNELYQDYACSCSLRVARELFSFLPLQTVLIHASGDILNVSTGYIEEQPILSVLIPLQTINTLNFDAIDPSSSMENFIHNMKYSKQNGLGVVERLNKIYP